MRRFPSVRLLLVIAVLVLAVTAAFGQAPGGTPGNTPPPPGGPGGGFGGSWWEGPWWNSRLVEDLNLSDTQKADIRAAVRDYRDKIIEIRSTIQKADTDVEAAFGENPVDQRKAGDAIERLASARGDMTRTLSQMSLKIRGVLTADQWKELQTRQANRRGRGPFRGGPFGREKGQGGPYSTAPGSNLTKQ